MIERLYDEERQRLEPRIRARLDSHAQLLKISPDQFLAVLRQTIMSLMASGSDDSVAVAPSVTQVQYQLSCVLDRWLAMIRSGASCVVFPETH